MKTKTASEGLFFEKRSQPRKGHFFRDMGGRDDAKFHEKSAMTSYSPGQIPSGGGANVAPKMGTGNGKVDLKQTGSPDSLSNKSESGQSAGGVGVYGTGSGKQASEIDRLQDLLANAAGGKEKTAARAPSDYDSDSGMPTGFHRPASKQPEALEDGGERFHSQSNGPSRGLVEGGKMNLAKGTGQNMGKHASAAPTVARFMGTSYGMNKSAAKSESEYEKSLRGAGSYTRGKGDQALDSLKRGGRQAGKALDEGIDAVTKSPAAMGIGALLLGRAGLGGAKRLGRLALGRKKPVGLAAGAIGGLKRMITGR